MLAFNHPENFLLGESLEWKKQANKTQDSFLNSARKERSNVTIYLMSGVKLTGRIKSFDKYSVILEAGSQEQLIFKHAISTVSLPRGGGRDFHHSSRPPISDREHQAEPGPGPQPGPPTGPDR